MKREVPHQQVDITHVGTLFGSIDILAICLQSFLSTKNYQNILLAILAMSYRLSEFSSIVYSMEGSNYQKKFINLRCCHQVACFPKRKKQNEITDN